MTVAPQWVGPSSSSGGPVPVHPMRVHPRALTSEPRTYLTAKEKEALALSANGKTNAAIARALGLSEETVKTRMQVVRRKLRAKDRTHAVAVALALGVLSLEDVVVSPDANRGYRDSQNRTS